MKDITPASVREFLLAKYGGPITALGFTPANISDDFDLLLNGVIDSFGILEMIGAIEDEFCVRLDMATLDAEQITIIGSLAHFAATNAKPA
jgi:acyl carrier protein